VAAGRTRRTRPRRVSLPGVHELLRPIGPGPASDSGRQASGREAHSQKITVYLSADELLELERARLMLRARGISVDRGRMVREAIAVLLADLESGADASVIARRLQPALVPVNGASPLNGSGPVNGAVPVIGGSPVNGAVPVIGGSPVNGAVPVIGASPGNAAVPVNGTTPAGGFPAEYQ
jgi:hypothetical protein